MGLDMYLYLRKYESCSKWDKDYLEKKPNFYPEDLKEFAEDINNRNFLSKQTLYQVGYWRKANAIHAWFVKNCADDVDECQEIYVSFKQAKELRNLINRVLDCHEKAEELLPTEDGFFFGNTEYNEWYYKNLEYTRDLLNKIIVKCDGGDYDIIYQASW